MLKSVMVRRDFLVSVLIATGWILLAGITSVTAADSLPEMTTDVCVIGGGSGGTGAALAASRAGANVILVEREAKLGGTSAQAYVTSWEPGPGCSFAREIYNRMTQLPNAVFPSIPYDSTLRRVAPSGASLPYDSDSISAVMAALLAETGKCITLVNHKFRMADVGPIAGDANRDGNVDDMDMAILESNRNQTGMGWSDGDFNDDGTVNDLDEALLMENWQAGPKARRIKSIVIESNGGTRYRVYAKVFIDCTGGGHVCRTVGCKMMVGADARSTFDEPSAPVAPVRTLNAVVLCYRIRESTNPVIQPMPDPPITITGGYAYSVPAGTNPTLNGYYKHVNPLGGMMAGWDLMRMGYDDTLIECRRRVQAHWHWLQQSMPGWEFDSYAPMLGIRESYRVVGEYVLREQDLRQGLTGQTHTDMIAIADHAVDFHGGGGLEELTEPYGVPYRCLLPKGCVNLMVACRGSSFSHIAAASCRLSRTMLQLGHAAGLGAAQAVEDDCLVGDIDVSLVQAAMGPIEWGSELITLGNPVITTSH